MKTKTLALTNGVVGLIGGIVLLFGGWLVMGGAITDVASNSATTTSGIAIILNILKIAILVLGILAAIYYKADNRIGSAPSVLLIIGGALALIPFLGWIGGIISIIGGSLYLASLKKFN